MKEYNIKENGNLNYTFNDFEDSFEQGADSSNMLFAPVFTSGGGGGGGNGGGPVGGTPTCNSSSSESR